MKFVLLISTAYFTQAFCAVAQGFQSTALSSNSYKCGACVMTRNFYCANYKTGIIDCYDSLLDCQPPYNGT